MENLGLCTEVTKEDCSKKEKEKGIQGHEQTYTLDPIPFSFLLTLCIAWVSGSPLIHSCSSHGGGGTDKNTTEFVRKSWSLSWEQLQEQERQEQDLEGAGCEEVGSMEDSPRKCQRWERESDCMVVWKWQWGQGLVFLQERGGQLCRDYRESTRGEMKSEGRSQEGMGSSQLWIGLGRKTKHFRDRFDRRGPGSCYFEEEGTPVVRASSFFPGKIGLCVWRGR